MLQRTLGHLAQDLAVDLGTTNTRVFQRGRGVVVEAPSVVALTQSGRSREIVAVGEAAHKMLGRTPEHITAVHPLEGGSIAHFDLAEALLKDCIGRALNTRPFVRPRMLVCVPQSTTEVQRRAVQDAARAAGGREITLISKSVAAAIGAGIPIEDPVASMILDLGGGTTEASVLSMGGIISSADFSVSGAELDQALARWIRESQGVQLGTRTAEAIKLAVGCAAPPETPRTIRVSGQHIESGIPREIEISSDDCSAAFQPVIQRLIADLQRVFAAMTPEVASDIADHGIVLTGGTALLPGLDRALQDHTGLPVVIAEDPHRATAVGAGVLLRSALLPRLRL